MFAKGAPQLVVVLVLCLLVPPFTTVRSNSDASSHVSFDAFVATHGHAYVVGTPAYEMRRARFEERVALVRLQNSKHGRWTAAINHFADRTDSELKRLHGWRGVPAQAKGGGKLAGFLAPASGSALLSYSTSLLPREVSWAHLKAVKDNVDQADCGSCWAVATSTVLGANAEISGRNRTFSAQDIVDCVPNPFHCGGSGGCDGATVELAMNWIMDQGVEDQKQVPYVGRDEKCSALKAGARGQISALSGSSQTLEQMTRVGFHGPTSQNSPGVLLGLRGWERLPENKYQPLMAAVAKTGPVAVSVGADNMWFMYSGGVFDSCSKDAVVNHAVTLIGYGHDAGNDEKYWIIKNSWGNAWGEDGKIRLLRQDSDDTEHCGVDDKPSEGLGCTGGPAKVKVCGMCGVLYDSVVPFFS